MSKLEKLIQKILSGKPISYEEAETFLLRIGFKVKSRGSHHVFTKEGYKKNISIKKRNELFPYQMQLLEEVIEFYEKTKNKN